jgi:hypothetical protein
MQTRSCRFNYLLPAVVFACLAAASPAARSQAKPQAQAKSGPDFTGIWEPGGGMAGGAQGRALQVNPPLQPAAMEQYKANRAGLTDPNAHGLDELDPSTYCFPPGAPRSMVMPYPFEIVQSADAIYILFEYGSGIRKIYTDGRKHPEQPEATWMGDSIGTWQGDTLVVDTVGLRPETWMDPAGTPHSDALHIVERFRRTKPDALEVQFVFDDPTAFTKPWGGTRLYELSKTAISPYFVCEENLQMGKSRDAAH